MNIRPAHINDTVGILKIWRVSQRLYDNLVPDYEKQRKVVAEAVSNSFHCCVVAGEKDNLTGVLMALSANNLWAQRKNCAIMLWEAEDKETGLFLVDYFKGWLQPKRGIKIAHFTADRDDDFRGVLLEERGFKKSGGYYIVNN